MSMRVSGHTLISEGAPHDDKARRIGYMGVGGTGRALCSCGDLSEILTSGGARRRWHTNHKTEVKP